MLKTYGGVGSRSTPQGILIEMTKVAETLAILGFVLRSGHADGADYAFEKGAQLNSEIYLPWKNFNSNLKMLGQPIVVNADPVLDSFVNRYHPASHRLSSGAFALMRRNTCQLLGLRTNTPADVVICWTPEGKAIGGTGQALRIAKDYKIPVINMFNHSTADSVMKELKNLGLV